MPNSATSLAPPALNKPVEIEIEYCVGCRWMLRAAWTAQELLTTFASQKEESERALGAVRLLPSKGKGGGVFMVRCCRTGGAEASTLVWDRKEEGGFPEMKALKQRLRDLMEPGKDLGHSDR